MFGSKLVGDIFMEKEKIIIADKLILKSITDSDILSLKDIFTNEEVSKTYMVPKFNTLEDVIRLCERIKELSYASNRYVYGIYHNSVLIGLVNDVEILDNEIELGIVINPKYKGNGYATITLKEMINSLLRNGFNKVKTGVFDFNKASLKVMEKCGMTRLDTSEEILYNDKVINCVLFEICK